MQNFSTSTKDTKKNSEGVEGLIRKKNYQGRGVQRTYGETTAVWEYERSSLLPRDSTSVKDWVAIALRALLSTFRSPDTLSLRT